MPIDRPAFLSKNVTVLQFQGYYTLKNFKISDWTENCNHHYNRPNERFQIQV